MDAFFQKWGNCLVSGNKIAEDVATLECFSVVFQNIINLLLILAGAIAIVIIIVSGLKFIFSGGDPKQVEGAKHTLTFALIGLIIILLSFAIISIISEMTQVNCIKFFGLKNCR